MKPQVFHVRWTSIAQKDFELAMDYIEQDHPLTALKIIQKVKSMAVSLKKQPYRGRVVPELLEWGMTIYRELIIKPWRLAYQIRGSVVEIVAFLDSRRNLDDILYQRALDISSSKFH